MFKLRDTSGQGVLDFLYLFSFRGLELCWQGTLYCTVLSRCTTTSLRSGRGTCSELAGGRAPPAWLRPRTSRAPPPPRSLTASSRSGAGQPRPPAPSSGVCHYTCLRSGRCRGQCWGTLCKSCHELFNYSNTVFKKRIYLVFSVWCLSNFRIYLVKFYYSCFVTTLPCVLYRGYPRVRTQPVLTPGADMRLCPGNGGGGLSSDFQPLVTRGGPAQGEVTHNARVIWNKFIYLFFTNIGRQPRMFTALCTSLNQASSAWYWKTTENVYYRWMCLVVLWRTLGSPDSLSPSWPPGAPSLASWSWWPQRGSASSTGLCPADRCWTWKSRNLLCQCLWAFKIPIWLNASPVKILSTSKNLKGPKKFRSQLTLVLLVHFPSRGE